MRVLWLILVLAGCGVHHPAEPRNPAFVAAERACAPQVDADLAVREIVKKGAGSEHYKYEHEDDLAAARGRALQACLAGGGVRRGGGVERQGRG